MEFLFVPRALVFLQIKLIHARLPDIFIRRTTFYNLTLIGVVKCQVVVSKISLSLKTRPNVGEESCECSNIYGGSQLADIDDALSLILVL